MTKVQVHKEKVIIESEEKIYVDIQNETEEELNFELIQEKNPKTIVIYITKA